MAILVCLGLGAGFVSAMLFVSISAAGLAAVLLMYLSPLPIMIVGIGWHHLVALLALAAGAIVASTLASPQAGTAFGLGPALAAWALAYLAATPRRGQGADSPEATRWRPAGQLLLLLGIAGSILAAAALIAAAGGDYARYVQLLERGTSAIMRRELDVGRNAPLPPSVGGLPSGELVRLVVDLAPALIAALMTLVLTVDLWLAGRAVAISGRLPRLWPEIPGARMPLAALLLMVGGALLVPVKGFAGVAGTAVLGGMLMVFALQGLALMHLATRNRPGRGLILSVAYLLVFVIGYALLPLFALLGMADTALPLRHALNGPPSA